MSMDPAVALWTLALYAGEPDPGGWELGDGTAVDLDACVLALADAIADRDDLAREAERLRGELAALQKRLALALGRDLCGQRFPPLSAHRASARIVAAREGWPDPCPDETVAPEGEQT